MNSNKIEMKKEEDTEKNTIHKSEPIDKKRKIK